MDSNNQVMQQATTELLRKAVDLKNRGYPDEKLVAYLTMNGIDSFRASMIVSQLSRARSEELERLGKRNIIIGGIVALVGLIVTLATSYNGGVVIIAWGAILYGIIQFFRGIKQLNSK